MSGEDVEPESLRIFRLLLRKGFPFACAGIWLDVFGRRLQYLPSAARIAKEPTLLPRCEQTGASLQRLLRSMTRRLLRADGAKMGGTALRQLAEQCAMLSTSIATDETVDERQREEVGRVMRDAFDVGALQVLDEALARAEAQAAANALPC